MASQLDKVIGERRDAAIAAVKRQDPKAEDITVSIGHGRVVVDYFDGDREAHRFEHVTELDELAAVQAEAATNIRTVVHG